MGETGSRGINGGGVLESAGFVSVFMVGAMVGVLVAEGVGSTIMISINGYSGLEC